MAELFLPDARDWIASGEAGAQQGMADRKNRAMTQAGGLMASGDYAGAAKALYTGGDIQTGSAVAQAGQQQASYADKLTRQKSVQAKLAAGDISGAYAAAGTDADLLGGLDKVADHAKETTATLAGALQGLKTPDGQWLPPDQARAKFAAMKPTLLARGLDPQQINGFDPTPENLSAIQGQVLGLTAQLAYHKPDWHEVKGADGSTTFEDLNPANRQSGAPEQAPAAAAPAQQAASADAPRGLRNNNPLNVSALPHGEWDGQTGTDGQYATFATPEAGWTAADKNLQSYSRLHGINTISGIVGRWAPPSENDTGAYTATVAKALGVAPDAQLNLGDPNVRRSVLEAMAHVENGQPVAFGGGAQHAAAPASAPALTRTSGPPTVAGSAAQPLEWQSDGKGNLVNRRTGDAKTDPRVDGLGVADPNIVKLVLDGRYPVPTGRAATDPSWQAVLKTAAAQDPTFDATNYAARYATRHDFASGKAANTRTALNTALGHAGDLDSQVDGLHNSPLHGLNVIGNNFADQTGDPRIKTFNLTKEALLHEALKVFSGSAGSLQEFKQLSDTLNVNDSPDQQHAVVKKLVGLLASKMDALGEQYRTGMGREATASQIMSPHAAQIYQKITGTPVPYAEDGGGQDSAAPGGRPPLSAFQRH